VVTRTRYARALAAVLLLEIANRGNPDPNHSAEIPPWLADGFAQSALASDDTKVILSAPAGTMNGLSQSRLDKNERGLDPLVSAHRTLQNFSVPTFDQLCWPGDAQLNGYDGGAYFAGAQLFVNDLLGLKNGADKLRAMLARLPGCMNWQPAFFSAFHDDFKRPLDVEKWWALRVVKFAAHHPGPRWPPAVSGDRLTGLLSVPVEFRNDSNSLPAHAEVSLQAVVRNFEPAQRDAVLQTKLRDLELSQYRLSPPFNGLAAGYCAAVADFLGDLKKNPQTYAVNRHAVPMRRRTSVADTLKKLDALDARRRELETKLDSSPLPQNLNRAPR